MVVDREQGHGLGSLLFRRLVEAALERNITRFHCVLLADNDPARNMIQDVASHVSVNHQGSEVEIDFDLDAARLPDAGSHGQGPIYGLFRAIASGQLMIARTLASLGHLWEDTPYNERKDGD